MPNLSLIKIRLLTFTVLMFFYLCGLLGAEGLDLTGLSIEELMDVQVTSVSKKRQTLSESAAAIFVITNDDLRRSGVTSIPDALRMVPGMNVSRIDSNKWAVSCRGFNSRFSANLLVLIDGRSVYTPTFSGVYREVNDVMLEDVARIEVIRGPGATLWGANAVNGVINIITKHPNDTQGGLVSVGAGSYDRFISSARYGGTFGKDTSWRIYGKYFDRDELVYQTGDDAGDGWDIMRGGFRLDSALTPNDTLRLQGDIYDGDINQELNLVTDRDPYMELLSFETPVSGWNLLSRWERTFSSTSDLALQIYYDTTERKQDIINEDRENVDIDFQHRFAAATSHDVVWGVRYRYTSDDFVDSIISDMDPLEKEDHLFSAFLQDEISFLADRLRLTLGSKFEHNDYTGVEVQPSARLLWAMDDNNTFWGAVSRAVRTPSRAESDAVVAYYASPSPVPGVPVVVNVSGNENFDSEELLAYEIGYRFIPDQKFSLDITLFYNEYDNVRGFEIQDTVFTGTAFEQDLVLSNVGEMETFGGELALVYMPSEFFKCDLAYSFLEHHFRDDELGGFPRHQVSARGQFNLSDTLDLDVWLRYVDETSAAYFLSGTGWYDIDDYVTMDVRLGWRVSPRLECALVGQNLLDSDHVEFVQEAFTQATEVKRAVFAQIVYRF